MEPQPNRAQPNEQPANGQNPAQVQGQVQTAGVPQPHGQGQRNYYQKRPYRGRGNYRGRGGRGYNRGGQGRGGNNRQGQNRGMGRSTYYNPFLAQEMIYRTEMYIYTKYNHLIDINVRSKGLSSTITEDSVFYVIKSFSEEDVHKSIKYDVWSSSKNGNVALNNSFKLTKEKNANVYLFFSCNGSGRFIGVARMKSPVDPEKSFEFWTQDQKWLGLFEVEWLFIKDIPFKEFKNIVITMKDGETKPVSNSRDCQEIPFQFAKTMIEIFESYQNTNTILEHFEYYDFRQDNYEKQMKHLAYAQRQGQPQMGMPMPGMPMPGMPMQPAPQETGNPQNPQQK
ncbi:MAG: YTH domain-containing protein [archaeon]|nr:YTH domain-containing protein [archaeon]